MFSLMNHNAFNGNENMFTYVYAFYQGFLQTELIFHDDVPLILWQIREGCFVAMGVVHQVWAPHSFGVQSRGDFDIVAICVTPDINV